MLAKQYLIVALFRHFCPRALNHGLLFIRQKPANSRSTPADRMDSIRLVQSGVAVMECLGL